MPVNATGEELTSAVRPRRPGAGIGQVTCRTRRKRGLRPAGASYGRSSRSVTGHRRRNYIQEEWIIIRTYECVNDRQCRPSSLALEHRHKEVGMTDESNSKLTLLNNPAARSRTGREFEPFRSLLGEGCALLILHRSIPAEVLGRVMLHRRTFIAAVVLVESRQVRSTAGPQDGRRGTPRHEGFRAAFTTTGAALNVPKGRFRHDELTAGSSPSDGRVTERYRSPCCATFYLFSRLQVRPMKNRAVDYMYCSLSLYPTGGTQLHRPDKNI